jgi:hypothetical protein
MARGRIYGRSLAVINFAHVSSPGRISVRSILQRSGEWSVLAPFRRRACGQASCGSVRKRFTGINKDCLLTGSFLPAPDRYIDVAWLQFDSVGAAFCKFSGKDGTS